MSTDQHSHPACPRALVRTATWLRCGLRRLLRCGAAAAAAASSVHAHVIQDAAAGGFAAGLMHPVRGADHLLAMVAVGIWGAVLGRPLLVALPVVFPMLMLCGAALSILGVPLAFVETGIGLSVVVLGAAIAAAWRAPIVLAVPIVGAFGMFHGYAHGTELPAAAHPAAYAAGFILATGLLHLGGIGIGSAWGRGGTRAFVRGIGIAIAVAGVWFVARSLPVGVSA